MKKQKDELRSSRVFIQTWPATSFVIPSLFYRFSDFESYPPRVNFGVRIDSTMDFGRIDAADLDGVDLTLPSDHEGTTQALRMSSAKNTEVFVGCAKWGRKDWVGKIYPEGTKEADFLSHYATHFNCIELNATFYRLPSVRQTAAWSEKVGESFKFCPKFSNRITHIKRLKDAERYTDIFAEGISAFGNKLGPCFLQLPPNYPPGNYDVIEAYLEALPRDLELFVELRHPKWYSEPDAFDRIFRILERQKAGAVITDAAGRRDCVHMRLTTAEAFIRFVGNGLHPTDYTRVDDWVQRIKSWMDHGIERVFFFMHQHEELHSPELSRYVIQQLNKHCGTNIAEPKFVAKEVSKPVRKKRTARK